MPPSELPPAAIPAQQEEAWTPVAELQAQMATDRRTFFHTEGRPMAYNPAQPIFRKPIGGDRVPLGERVILSVEEVHFGNARCRLMGEPAPLPQMLKWGSDKFDEHVLECAEIDFGEYRVWSAVGIRSNRLLYAMKRSGAVIKMKGVVVAAPVPELDDEVDLTYGTSIQAIQLVP
jgi:hypothetical protein